MKNDKRNAFRGDVWFEVWRSGGDPDAVDDDRIDDCYDSGACAVECASAELRKQRRRRDEEDFDVEG